MTRVNKRNSHKMMAIALVGFLSFGGSFIVAKVRGFPVPYIYGEFSYLLAADTFAHGRVTNPPHPLGEHFETFHELMKPTYMSKYPPGHGAFMALGQVVFGHPIYGVWLSAALMCMAICWMLYAWVTPSWALAGGLIAVLQFGVFTYWSQSYWGGTVAAMGGALVFGSLARILKYQRTRDTLWFGLGFALLANSRPYEGILIGIPFGLLVLPWTLRLEKIKTLKFVQKIIIPVGIAMMIAIMGTGAYNKAVTGNALIFPHVLFSKTYSSVPNLIWQPLRPPVQNNPMIFDLYEQTWTKGYYLYKRTWDGFWQSLKNDSFKVFGFYFGYPLAIGALLGVLFLARSWPLACRILLGIMVLLLAMASMYCRAKPHYFSALTSIGILLVVVGLRALSAVKLRKTRIGLMMVIFLFVFQLIFNILRNPVLTLESLARGMQGSQLDLPMQFTREELKSILMAKGGKHLVIVKHQEGYQGYREWVFNDADIDHARIVWARDRGESHNFWLREYFKDHRAWHIEVFMRGKGYDNTDER